MSDEQGTIWAMSNRVDDRIVLWEQDPAHPGGEAFIGGSTPDHVARTPAIEGLLRDRLIVEVPEPPDGPKKPIPIESEAPSAVAPNQPGQPIKLGRIPDPDLVPDGANLAEPKVEEIAVPRGVIVPPPIAPERSGTQG